MDSKSLIINKISQTLGAGKSAEARQQCLQALKLSPNDADFLNLLGVISFGEGNFAEAADYYQKAITRSPATPALYSNLAMVFEHTGETERAIGLLQKAVELNPDLHGVHARLGALLNATGNPDAAQKSYGTAIRLAPGDPATRYYYASLLQAQGKHQDAVEHLQLARKLQPGNIKILVKLVDILLTLGEFTTTEALKEEIIALLEAARAPDASVIPDLHELIFYLPYLSISGYQPATLTQHLERTLPQPVFNFVQRTGTSDVKMRLGYISPHFGNQPISHVTRSLYGLHNRDRFEVTIYSLMDRRSDPGTYLDDIKAGCDRFIDLAGVNPLQAADRIHSDNIDILVDLTGYMPGIQLPILSQRPAPIQVYWLGHGGGLGLSFIDYVIADHTVVSRGEETLYTEKVVRLPDIYHSTDTLPISSECPPRSSFGLAEKAFVFCAFNNQIKIDRDVFSSWMRILQRVPESQLWLSNLQQLDQLSQNLKAEAQQFGVDPDRLVFTSAVRDKSIHLARHQLADLFLDTFTYNASTTALDALWGGLPLLTLKGPYFQSRIAASMLKNVGLEDMICNSIKEYEARAVELAGNPDLLAGIRARLWKNRETEPLFNTQRFVRHLEAAYETMWHYYRNGEEPQCFDVPLRMEYVGK